MRRTAGADVAPAGDPVMSGGERLNWWFQISFDVAFIIFLFIIVIHVGRRR